MKVQQKIQHQFYGFISTNPLWLGSNPFHLEQFLLPQMNYNNGLDPEQECPGLNSNFVLGKRAESFFQLVIQVSGQYELLAANLQVSKEKITLGEIDFILKDTYSNKIYHVELVYKFYIYDPSFPAELQRWIGPNRRDSLLRKISRLKNHQLPLLYGKETEPILNSLEINPEHIEQQVCFLANLFTPKNSEYKDFPYINNRCIAGYWIHFTEFREEEYASHYYCTPKKPDWPILPEDNSNWYSYSEIMPEVNDLILQKKAPLIWMKTAAGDFERFFIVWW